jgi:Sortase domain
MLTPRRVPLARVALIGLVAVLATVGAMRLGASKPAEAAGAALSFPSTVCGGATTPVTFNWAPVEGAVEQWLDLSTADNHFAPGTYRGFKLTPGVKTLDTTTIDATSPHYWRINSRTVDGWVASSLGQFVPCGGPQLLWGPAICQSGKFATVNFNWAPRADAIGYQWLELSSTVSFDEVVRVGPLALSAQNYTRGGFSVDERTYFRIAWEGSDGTRVITPTASFVPDCTVPTVSSALYYSADRLVSTSLGIDAPVNVRDVGFSGFLGVPSGAYDVVRYNFAALPSLKGYPGDGGVTMIGGHVDYYSVGLAIFAPLRSAQPGMSVEYRRGDGVVVKYQIDWVRDVPFSTSLNSYLHNRGPDELILITCNGTFDQAAHRYDLRRMVHAIRVN